MQTGSRRGCGPTLSCPDGSLQQHETSTRAATHTHTPAHITLQAHNRTRKPAEHQLKGGNKQAAGVTADSAPDK